MLDLYQIESREQRFVCFSGALPSMRVELALLNSGLA